MSPTPAEDETAWMQDNVDDTRVPGIIACTIVCGAAALVVAILRMYARLAPGRWIELNDWLFLMTLCFFMTFDVVFAITTLYGGGRHIITITNTADLRMLGVLTVVNENTYAIAVTIVKLSMLSLLDSMFPSKNFRRCLVSIACFTSSWATVVLVVTNIQCVPLEYAWNRETGGGRCINHNIFALVTSAANTLGSFAMLALPVPMILRVNLSRRKQMIVMVNFATGAAVCAVEMVRFGFLLHVGNTSNTSWANVSINTISTVELTLGLLCASLPTYSYFLPGIHAPSPDRAHSHEGTRHLRGCSPADINTKITGGQTLGPRRSGIAVTDDITMMTHANVNGAWVRVPDDDGTNGRGMSWLVSDHLR